MRKQEEQSKKSYWRCSRCGHRTPIEEAICCNPSCRADLGIYGVAMSYDTEQENLEQDTNPQKTEEKAERKAEKPKKQKRRKNPRGHGRGVAVLLILLVLVGGAGVGLFFGLEPLQNAAPYEPPQNNSDVPPDTTEPEEDSTQPMDDVPAVPWQENVLMSDPCDGKTTEEVYGAPAFGTAISRETVGTVTFFSSLDRLHAQGRPDEVWDVSQAQDGSVLAWCEWNAATQTYDLYLGAEGGISAPANGADLFRGYRNVTEINFNGAFHTENVTRMDRMFNDCMALETLDVSGFDTSEVTTMYCMFYQCERLTELDVSGFDTSKVTNLSWMFWNCASLSQLDLSGFDTAQVTDMSFLFCGCTGLSQLNVSGLDTSNVTSMAGMFSYCEGLAELDVSSFDTSAVTNMNGMFLGCTGLTELDVSGFDTSQVTNMGSMFEDCSHLAELDLSHFCTSQVTDMSFMLHGVQEDFALYYQPELFDTSNVVAYDGFMEDSFDWKKLFE